MRPRPAFRNYLPAPGEVERQTALKGLSLGAPEIDDIQPLVPFSHCRSTCLASSVVSIWNTHGGYGQGTKGRTMFVTRAIVSCALLLSMSGCSHLFRRPAQYTSLPQAGDASLSQAEAYGIAGSAEETTRNTRRLHTRISTGVDPLAALQRSIYARAAWEQLNPTDLTNASGSVASRGRGPTPDGALEPTATNSLLSARTPSGLAQTKSENYDREATMSRLLKDGEEAAKPICLGC